jgi:hypothetical protein
MIRKYLLIALAAGAVMTAASSPAQAREGCGPGGHRGPAGHCRPNRGHPPRVMVRPGGPVVGIYYGGRGYWDGHRYWQHRERHRGGWRYR